MSASPCLGQLLNPLRIAISAAAVYLATGAVYIWLSTRWAAAGVRSAAELERLELIKGTLFVLTSSLVLFLVVWLLLRRVAAAEHELVRQHERVAASETFLQSVFLSINLPILVIDVIAPDVLRIANVNEAFARLAQSSAIELIGRAPRDLPPAAQAAAPHADDLRRCLQLRQAVEKERHIQLGDHEHWLLFRLAPVLDADGQPCRVVGLIVELTSLRHAERRLRERELQLNQVGRLAVLGEMAAAITHELSQPLHAIATFAAAIRREAAAADPPLTSVVAWIEQVQQQVERAAAISQRLRSVAQGGQLQISAARVDELIDETLELFAPTADAWRVRLAPQPVDTHWTIDVDRLAWQQVLVNLLQNACEAMVDAPAAQREVELSATRENGEVVVRVRDRGPGVPAEQADEIFRPFVTTKTLGLGMGLSLSRSIAEAHGGRLWVEPGESGGAIFCLATPLSTGA